MQILHEKFGASIPHRGKGASGRLIRSTDLHSCEPKATSHDPPHQS